ncbi:Clp protease N-terminal domain-containing protein [Streptacidiphilus fuscans]|uniref:Clp protease n=1 Tax=Streptacidiphilus fuscans TaxID=2789292 RepID=A0A931B563_9ACTN|nr:Clp protease N-terminal domain-containing protein [Streptacidiphilus fuscans]MBF9069196.1 Clp protease [Streptacidiphilus fuscans]
MFERFTADCRRTVVLAQEEARMLRHPMTGSEHLLLGLLGLPDDASVALLADGGLDLPTARQAVQRLLEAAAPELDAEALGTIGIDLDAVREKVESVFGVGALSATGPASGPGPGDRRRGGRGVLGGHLPFTPDAKKALELSLREALALSSREILPGHLLGGLLREEQSLAARVVRDHGFDLPTLRDRVRATLT